MYKDDPYFAFIDNVSDFRDMIAHLERQREVAVDLENHSVSLQACFEAYVLTRQSYGHTKASFALYSSPREIMTL